ncbi:DUF934 domain-containing protein [Nitrogeniibacter mangrovi]|uniref:DUF934 domain-containing protein n=1 Tax=Nitrogeniibacter mangrovi TaxID=2016596 RepID=A0A6C1B139_9RHOO|nr:DUF934 domain-containing protein [Nitrogeniibacter mangrovi]QID16709.1 DUF934 domain-containing protein [Nitrogeniibacter mangrovi]
MAKLIKNQAIVDDAWQVLTLAEDQRAETVTVGEGQWIVPLSVFLAQPALQQRSDVAVWLDGDDEPADVAPFLAQLPLVAVRFPKFSDGRGYSIATLLRSRHGHTGELRAIGDVLRDQFDYLGRCGFDALQPDADRYTDAQLEDALNSLTVFSEPYQASVTIASPLFRRQRRAA